MSELATVTRDLLQYTHHSEKNALKISNCAYNEVLVHTVTLYSQVQTMTADGMERSNEESTISRFVQGAVFVTKTK